MTNLKDCRTDAKTEEKRVKKEEEKRNGHRQQTNKLIHAHGYFFMKNTPRHIESNLETEILAT
jgi:hypothetical protein